MDIHYDIPEGCQVETASSIRLHHEVNNSCDLIFNSSDYMPPLLSALDLLPTIERYSDHGISNQSFFIEDILKHIIPFCPIPTLFNLLLTSKTTYTLTLPNLYQSITFDPDNRHADGHSSTSPCSSLLSVRSQIWGTEPKIHVKDMTIPAHLDNHSCVLMDLPNLHTLRLAIHPKSPIGWSFCKPSDKVRYPYYPINQPCSLLVNLQPKRLLITSGIRYLNTPSPFPLPSQSKFWTKIEEVVLCVSDNRENMREESKVKYKDGFLKNLPKGLKRLIIIFGMEGVDVDEILDGIDSLHGTPSVSDNISTQDIENLYGLGLVSDPNRKVIIFDTQ